MDDLRVRQLVQEELRASDLGVLLRQMQGLVTVGHGAPTDAPSVDRAVYVDLDGGAATTLYVWEGAAWAAK